MKVHNHTVNIILVVDKYYSLNKGQLISECLLGIIEFPKNHRKIWQISA